MELVEEEVSLLQEATSKLGQSVFSSGASTPSVTGSKVLWSLFVNYKLRIGNRHSRRRVWRRALILLPASTGNEWWLIIGGEIKCNCETTSFWSGFLYVWVICSFMYLLLSWTLKMTIFEGFNQTLAVNSVHIQKKIWRVFGCKFKLQNWNRIVFSDCLVLFIGIFVFIVMCNVPIAWNYLLRTEFEVGAVSFGPSFFHLIYGPSAKRTGYELKGGNTFEARTVAGRELFSCLTYLQTTTFILLSIWKRPQACHAKCSRFLSLS